MKRSNLTILILTLILLGCNQNQSEIQTTELSDLNTDIMVKETTPVKIATETINIAETSINNALTDDTFTESPSLINENITVTPTYISVPTTLTITPISNGRMTPMPLELHSGASIRLYSEDFGVEKNNNQLELDKIGDGVQEIKDIEFRITRSGGGQYYFFWLFPIKETRLLFWGEDKPQLDDCKNALPDYLEGVAVDKIFPGANICVISSQGHFARVQVTETNLPEGWIELDFDTWISTE